jgi:oligopeptide/dipeptide ABC transporter ATP-binding protein
MYLGRIVEIGTEAEIYDTPLHPYTQALLSAEPQIGIEPGQRRERILLKGEVPSPANPPSGCPFRTRCWKAQSICAEVIPVLEQGAGGNQKVACHFPEPIRGQHAQTQHSNQGAVS